VETKDFPYDVTEHPTTKGLDTITMTRANMQEMRFKAARRALKEKGGFGQSASAELHARELYPEIPTDPPKPAYPDWTPRVVEGTLAHKTSKGRAFLAVDEDGNLRYLHSDTAPTSTTFMGLEEVFGCSFIREGSGDSLSTYANRAIAKELRAEWQAWKDGKDAHEKAAAEEIVREKVFDVNSRIAFIAREGEVLFRSPYVTVPAAPSLWHFHKGDHDTAYRAAKAYAEKQRAAKTPAPVTDPGPEYEFTSTAGSTCFYRAARGEVQFRAKLGAWIPDSGFHPAATPSDRLAFAKARADADAQKAARKAAQTGQEHVFFEGLVKHFFRAKNGNVEYKFNESGAWIPYAPFVGLENERKLWTSAAYHKAARDAEQQKAAR
jgi:hypothetical protein